MDPVGMVERGKLAGDVFVEQNKNRVQPLMVSFFYWIETILMMLSFLLPWAMLLFWGKSHWDYLAGIFLLVIWAIWLTTRILNKKKIVNQKIWLQNNVAD